MPTRVLETCVRPQPQGPGFGPPLLPSSKIAQPSAKSPNLQRSRRTCRAPPSIQQPLDRCQSPDHSRSDIAARSNPLIRIDATGVAPGNFSLGGTRERTRKRLRAPPIPIRPPQLVDSFRPAIFRRRSHGSRTSRRWPTRSIVCGHDDHPSPRARRLPPIPAMLAGHVLIARARPPSKRDAGQCPCSASVNAVAHFFGGALLWRTLV
jgi:hypothetical protein